MTCCCQIWNADILFGMGNSKYCVNEVTFTRQDKYTGYKYIDGFDMDGCLMDYNRHIVQFAACSRKQAKLCGGMLVISQPSRSVLFC